MSTIERSRPEDNSDEDRTPRQSSSKGNDEPQRPRPQDDYQQKPAPKRSRAENDDHENRTPKQPRAENGNDENRAPKRSRTEDGDQENRTIKRPRAENGDVETQAPKRPRPEEDDEENQAPRPRKRPGKASRISTVDIEQSRLKADLRAQEAQQSIATRTIDHAVKDHYNAVPQRGREWRSTDSKIKGLRKFNNWVKSTIIHKFSSGEGPHAPLTVLDIGCGKGGDLGKWQSAPQPVGLYVGIDPAEVSIDQARERYRELVQRNRGGRFGRGRPPAPLFEAHFISQDAFGQSIGTIPIIRDVGFDDQGGSRWNGGGFDVVTMMFCMHYAFESEEKAKGMLRNVAGALKKGGRLVGTIPNSDIIRNKVESFYKDHKEDENPEWGNSLYRVRFPNSTPKDGKFRPAYGHKYNFFLDEAVEEVPEYVVPWEAFRGIAEDFGLEQQYREPFDEVWKTKKDDRIYGPLSERMGVRDRITGELLVTKEEMEAASFYHAFSFYKV